MCRYTLSLVFSALLLWSANVSAQDTTAVKSQNTSSTTTTEFHIQPWMWIAGAVVLLLVILALFRGGGDKTTVSRTTVIKETQN